MANQVLIDQKDEVFYEANVNSLAGNSAVQFLYAPEVLYSHNDIPVIGYEHVPDDKIINVDVAFLKLATYKDSEQISTYQDGNFKDTNVAGAFYAIDKADYFYVENATDADLTVPSLKRGSAIPRVAEVINLPEYSSGGTFANQTLQMYTPNVCRYEDLEVDGLNEGYMPKNMKALAIRLEKSDVEDVTYRCFDQGTISNGVNTEITEANAVAPKIDADMLRENSNAFVHEDPLYTGSSYVSAVEIVNVERGLSDFRYGDPEDEEDLVFTDTVYVFSDAQLADVEAGTPLLINDINVGGGDCFIGLHTVKLTDSTYSLTDPEKDITGEGGIPGVKASQADKWGQWFDRDGEGQAEEDVSRPIPLKGVSQTLTVWLESEINPEMAEPHPHKGYTDSAPYPIPDSAGQIRSVFNYRYSKDYTKLNNDKVLLPFSTFETDTTDFNARVYFTDQKVYKSDVEGFDRVRVLNFMDLDETYGDIAGFWPIQDNMMVFQERGVSILPVGKSILEQSDGAVIQVRSGDILGTPRYISTTYGTQDPKTIDGDDNNVFAIDNRNKVVLGFTPNGLDIVSNRGMRTYFSGNLGSAVSKDYLFGIFDPVRNQYIAGYRANFTVIYDANDGIWIGRWPNSATIQMMGGEIADGVLYPVLSNTAGTRIGVNKAESGTYGKWGPDTSLPKFTVYFNQEPVIPKTFDSINWNSTWTPTNVDVSVPLQASETGMSLTGYDISTKMAFQEGTYRWAEDFRAEAPHAGKRFRGMLLELTSRFPQNQTGRVSTIAIKYRPSHKAI